MTMHVMATMERFWCAFDVALSIYRSARTLPRNSRASTPHTHPLTPSSSHSTLTLTLSLPHPFTQHSHSPSRSHTLISSITPALPLSRSSYNGRDGAGKPSDRQIYAYNFSSGVVFANNGDKTSGGAASACGAASHGSPEALSKVCVCVCVCWR